MEAAAPFALEIVGRLLAEPLPPLSGTPASTDREAAERALSLHREALRALQGWVQFGAPVAYGPTRTHARTRVHVNPG